MFEDGVMVPDMAGHPVSPGMIRHSDAGSQCRSIKFTETVALQSLVHWMGTIGDAYGNSAEETVMGLYTNGAVAKNSLFSSGALKTLADVGELTFDWLDRYNNRRLHSPLGDSPPGECETNFCAETTGPLNDDAANKTAAWNPAWVHAEMSMSKIRGQVSCSSIWVRSRRVHSSAH
jgi:putative transposase